MTNLRLSAVTSYADYAKAAAYADFFPVEFRATNDTMPIEQRWAWRDLSVHLDRLDAPDSTIKVIVLHGAGAYGRIMAPATVIARKHGYSTVTPDLPGYGLTQAPREQLNYQLWVDCVCDLIDAEIARDGLPVVLFGVSLGGLLAYQVAAQSKRVIGVVATTMVDAREPAAAKSLARNALLGGPGSWFLRRFARITDGLPMPMGQVTKMHAISNNKKLASLVKSDRRGGGNWMPARFLRTLLAHVPAVEPERFDVCPILIVHPADDRMTNIEHSRSFYARLPGSEATGDKQFVTLPNTSHMPTEPEGLALMQQAVLAFLQQRTREVASVQK
jgi:alpha-beta hydrolase superfamily lysophospholipase